VIIIEISKNMKKFFKKRYGKGDFVDVDDGTVIYETLKGDVYEVSFDKQDDDNSIKNYTNKKEVNDMGKKKETTKDEITEDAAPPETMEAKYVRLQENTEQPDPEIVEADRKHVDMDKEKEIEEEIEEGDEDEAGKMEAKTPNKKKGDMDELKTLINSIKTDFSKQLEAQNKKLDFLEKENKQLRAEKIAEKELVRNDLIEDMAIKYKVPKDWLQEHAKKYDKEDFVEDLYEGLSFAFGTLPGHEIERKTEDMSDKPLITKVPGLEMM